ncbi:MAG: dolichyl-phosphate-mannose--protein mannosyltransferase [Cellulomonadaceae bacterium]
MTSPTTPPAGTPAAEPIAAAPHASEDATRAEHAPDGTQDTPDTASTHERLLVALLGERALRLGATARERLWGWIGPLSVTLLAAVLRLWDLARPPTLVFDETYYVKQAYTLLMVGFDADWPDEPNADFEAGNRDVFLDKADYVVHPPVGKWMIAGGMRLLGADNPASWRLATAVVGILAVLIVARVARRLFSSTAAGVVAGGLFAVDGAAIVHARTGLLDSFVMFWALVAFALLVADRFRSRRILADRAAQLLDAGRPLGRFGPSSGLRWYRLAAAVALGLCIGTKWSGMYFLAVFAVVSVLWDATARRRIGVTGWPVGTLVKDALPAAATMLPVAAATYLTSWAGWFANPKSWGRTWAADHPGEGVQWLPEALRSLWHYHGQMWEFHNNLSSPHTYQAHPLGWLLQWRPTSFYYQSQDRGEPIPVGGTCEWDRCTQAITSLGNPVIWWLGTLAVVLAIWMVVRRQDWRAVAVLSGVVAGWVPWLGYAHRTIFTFYTIAFAPFVYLTLAYAFVVLWERSADNPARRARTRAFIAVVLVIIAVVSVLFYPIWTALNVPTWFWRAHMWLPSWV